MGGNRYMRFGERCPGEAYPHRNDSKAANLLIRNFLMHGVGIWVAVGVRARGLVWGTRWFLGLENDIQGVFYMPYEEYKPHVVPQAAFIEVLRACESVSFVFQHLWTNLRIIARNGIRNLLIRQER